MDKPRPALVKRTFLVCNHVHHKWIREGARALIAHDTDPETVLHSRRVCVLIKKGRHWRRYWTRASRLYAPRIVTAEVPVGGAQDRLGSERFDSTSPLALTTVLPATLQELREREAP